MSKEQRDYDVTFKTLDKYHPMERTVRVKCADSVHASILVYQMYGRKKIKVTSAKKVGKK